MDDLKKKEGTTRKGLPWWFYLVSAILSYYVLKYYLPDMAVKKPEINQLIQLAEHVAPIITIVFLILAANKLYKDTPPSQNKEEDTSVNDQ